MGCFGVGVEIELGALGHVPDALVGVGAPIKAMINIYHI